MSAQSTTVTWRHSDSTPELSLTLALTARQYETKPDGTAFTTADRVRLLRSLGVATVDAINEAMTGGAKLVKPGEMETETRMVGRPLAPTQFPTKGHAYAAGALAIPFQLFADPGFRPVYSAVTHDGDPPVLDERAVRMIGSRPHAEETANPLLEGFAIVVVAAAWVAAVCYGAQCAANIIDRKLARDAATARMMAAHAAAVQMVALHNARDKAGGGPTPYTPEENKIIDALVGTAARVAEETHSPLQNPFFEATKRVGSAAEKVADKASGGLGFGLGLAAVVAAGGYYVWTQIGKREPERAGM